jgi:hypothetical protein
VVAGGAVIGGVVTGGDVVAAVVVGRAVVATALVEGRTVVTGAAVVDGVGATVVVTADAPVLCTSLELPQPANRTRATTIDKHTRTRTPRP